MMKKRNRNLFFIVLMFLLEGCKTTPPSHFQADITAPQTTRTGIKIVDNSNDLSQVLWWEKMHDPQLNHLIHDALMHNNQILNAQANILQAQAQLQQARFAWIPTLNATGNGFVGGGWDSQFFPQGALARSGALSQLGAIHFRGYASGFVPHYSLNILANMNRDKLAKATLNMQKAAYQSVRLSVISQISGAYFMLLGQKEQLKEQSQLIRDLKEVRRLEQVRFKRGASDLSTITNLDSQIATNQASLDSIQNSLSQVENSIQVLLNHNPGPVVTHRTINTLPVRGLIPAHIPSSVLKSRPDIIMAQENLKIAESNIGMAYSNFFPTLSLTGLFGRASVELSHLLSLSTGLWITQAAASLPLLNGASYEQIKAAKAGYSAACFSYIQTMKSVFADVDNSLMNQQKMYAIYVNQLKALQASQTLYRLVLARYKAGAKDYRDVANAQLNVDYAKLDLNSAKMQQLDSIVEVYQALAGGYNPR